MGQSIIAVVLTILFYITSLFGGGTSNTSVPNQYQYTPSQQEQPSSSIIGQTAVVLGNKVTVRSGPGTDYTAVSSVDKGLEVTLLEAKDGWYKVRFASGQNGWIAGYLLNVLPYSSVLKNSTSGKMVLGYYLLNNQSYESMLENSQVLTGIAPWSWELDSYGGLQASFDEEKLGETLQFAGNKGLETYALIHNLQNGYFDSQTATNLLNNSIAQERAINNIYQTLLDWGMKGV
ncbi:MAG: SH3 domain-containing protein, partial [Firmicutes bacterium]|nr:SH3 domain-containing protein [Bacillota bacterium]